MSHLQAAIHSASTSLAATPLVTPPPQQQERAHTPAVGAAGHREGEGPHTHSAGKGRADPASSAEQERLTGEGMPWALWPRMPYWAHSGGNRRVDPAASAEQERLTGGGMPWATMLYLATVPPISEGSWPNMRLEPVSLLCYCSMHA